MNFLKKRKSLIEYNHKISSTVDERQPPRGKSRESSLAGSFLRRSHLMAPTQSQNNYSRSTVSVPISPMKINNLALKKGKNQDKNTTQEGGTGMTGLQINSSVEKVRGNNKNREILPVAPPKKT